MGFRKERKKTTRGRRIKKKRVNREGEEEKNGIRRKTKGVDDVWFNKEGRTEGGWKEE